LRGFVEARLGHQRQHLAPPWVGSRSPDGWDQIPRWAGGWACTSHPGVLGSFPKREEPGKTGRHPVLKYRVPHGSHPPSSLVCGGQPSPHKPRLVVSHSTCPPLSSSPHAHSFVLTAVINNKTSREVRHPSGELNGDTITILSAVSCLREAQQDEEEPNSASCRPISALLAWIDAS
jgi:hypothetical protein